jgi:hypothetical protein
METVLARERKLRVMSERNGNDSIFITIEDTGAGISTLLAFFMPLRRI